MGQGPRIRRVIDFCESTMSRVLSYERIPIFFRKRGWGKPGISHSDAFSLVEILVAVAVLALLLTLTLQVLTNTNTAIRSADRRMDAATQARSAMDRFESDFSTAILTHGATAICTVGTSSSPSSIGFLCRARARDTPSGSAAWRNDLRGAIIAYRMGTALALERGDGRFTFSQNTPADSALSDLPGIFTSLGSVLNSGDSFLEWNSMGDGIVRFHISYQLDNGEIVQSPPEYTMLSPQSRTITTFLNGLSLSPQVLPIAFSAHHAPVSGPLAGRYVRALIVGMVTLDRDARKLSESRLSELDGLGTPTSNGETPLEIWEQNVADLAFAPLRENIRLYQRVIPVP